MGSRVSLGILLGWRGRVSQKHTGLFQSLPRYDRVFVWLYVFFELFFFLSLLFFFSSFLFPSTCLSY